MKILSLILPLVALYLYENIKFNPPPVVLKLYENIKFNPPSCSTIALWLEPRNS